MAPPFIGAAACQRLGVRRLLRSIRTLTLTAEGRAYLQAARPSADLNDAEQQIADQGSGPRSRLCGLLVDKLR